MTDLATLVPLAEALIAEAKRRKLKIAAAESCTGGLVAAALTEVPGSSAVLDRSFVTYSDAAKTDMLGVAKALLDSKGAVSEDVARAMASGAIAHSAADLAVAITGIAGPDGGSAEKPIGLVHFAVLRRNGKTRHIARRFPDNGRSSIRLAATAEALRLLTALAQSAQTETP
jgi:nicotinamide-nucleotide amidase